MTNRMLKPKHIIARGLPKEPVYRALHDGTLPSVKIGNRFYIAESALEEFMSKIARGELERI